MSLIRVEFRFSHIQMHVYMCCLNFYQFKLIDFVIFLLIECKNNITRDRTLGVGLELPVIVLINTSG